MTQSIRVWPLACLLLLLVLYANVWMWDADQILFGFPVNLLYHAGLCVLTSVVMLVVINFAWPHDLDRE